jgi:hypothetical protein
MARFNLCLRHENVDMAAMQTQKVEGVASQKQGY